jgi:glycosyltransferase involved in cell wall biosynthesis
MTRLRVVHAVPASFGEAGILGGAERYARELARRMAAVTSTRLITFSEAPARRSVGHLDIRVLGPTCRVRGQVFNPFHTGLVRHLAWAQVVHCHQRTVVASSFSAAFCRATGRRVFVTDLGGGGWDISAYVSTDRWFHGHIHICEFSRSVAGHAGWTRARVICGGVDTERFAPDPAVAKEPLVVFVGRIMPHKGINDLIEALPDGLTLEVIGRPYHEPYCEELQRRSVRKSVRFRTDCNVEELVRAYRRAICVVLPRVYRTTYGDETRVPELLGHTLLEGMACGTPAICTNVAAMPQVVVDGKTGFVVPPNNPPRAAGETRTASRPSRRC